MRIPYTVLSHVWQIVPRDSNLTGQKIQEFFLLNLKKYCKPVGDGCISLDKLYVDNFQSNSAHFDRYAESLALKLFNRWWTQCKDLEVQN